MLHEATDRVRLERRIAQQHRVLPRIDPRVFEEGGALDLGAGLERIVDRDNISYLLAAVLAHSVERRGRLRLTLTPQFPPGVTTLDGALYQRGERPVAVANMRPQSRKASDILP